MRKISKKNSTDYFLNRLRGWDCENVIEVDNDRPEFSIIRNNRKNKHINHEEENPFKLFFPGNKQLTKYTKKDFSSSFSTSPLSENHINLPTKIFETLKSAIRLIRTNENTNKKSNMAIINRPFDYYLKRLMQRYQSINIFSKELFRTLIKLLSIFNSIPCHLLLPFSEMISNTLDLIGQELEKRQLIHPQQLSYLTYYCTNLPIDWIRHQYLLEQVFRIFHRMCEENNYIWNYYDALFRMLGCFAKLSIVLPNAQLNVDLRFIFDKLEGIINKIPKNDRFYKTNIYGRIIMRDFHLLWQYCVWQFGKNVHRDRQHLKLINLIESIMQKDYYSLTDDEDHHDLFDISQLERHILNQVTRLLGKYPNIVIHGQAIVGCYSIDIEITIANEDQTTKRIAIEVYGPHHYFGQEGRAIRLKDRFRNQLLENFGYSVLIIPYFEVNNCKPYEIRTLLLNKLKNIPAFQRLLSPSVKREAKYIPPHRRRAHQNWNRRLGSHNDHHRRTSQRSSANNVRRGRWLGARSTHQREAIRNRPRSAYFSNFFSRREIVKEDPKNGISYRYLM